MLVSPAHDGGSLRPIDWETLKDGGNSISRQMTERFAARCLSACLSLVYLFAVGEGKKKKRKRRGKASLSQMFAGWEKYESNSFGGGRQDGTRWLERRGGTY